MFLIPSDVLHVHSDDAPWTTKDDPCGFETYWTYLVKPRYVWADQHSAGMATLMQNPKELNFLDLSFSGKAKGTLSRRHIIHCVGLHVSGHCTISSRQLSKIKLSPFLKYWCGMLVWTCTAQQQFKCRHEDSLILSCTTCAEFRLAFLHPKLNPPAWPGLNWRPKSMALVGFVLLMIS